MMRKVRGIGLVVAATFMAAVLPAKLAAQEDPGCYAKMGSPLWNALAHRQIEGLPAHLLPFYVFTDGKNITVAPQAFVANYKVSDSNPVKRVLPGPGTIEDSGKYPVIPFQTFLSKNEQYVNRVTRNRPVRAGLLNVYTTALGNPTSVDYMGK